MSINCPLANSILKLALELENARQAHSKAHLALLDAQKLFKDTKEIVESIENDFLKSIKGSSYSLEEDYKQPPKTEKVKMLDMESLLIPKSQLVLVDSDNLFTEDASGNETINKDVAQAIIKESINQNPHQFDRLQFRKLRLDLGLKQSELATLLKNKLSTSISQDKVSAWELGKKTPKYLDLMELAIWIYNNVGQEEALLVTGQTKEVILTKEAILAFRPPKEKEQDEIIKSPDEIKNVGNQTDDRPFRTTPNGRAYRYVGNGYVYKAKKHNIGILEQKKTGGYTAVWLTQEEIERVRKIGYVSRYKSKKKKLAQNG